ncbi:Arm DNA-binding domain-containing protein [Sedimentitalea sp.]|uniref:Arm DNA-binding domain-containing protein n=1 Tax=Sedimentitalea sp. TaxID=2048915 RepID=UPI0032984399
MPALKMKLSARSLAELEPGNLAWDTEVKGFGARKAKDGRVSLFLNYQVRGTGKYRRVAIAHLGECTVDTARRRAAQMRMEIRAGIDVAKQTETPAARAASGDTLGQYVESWLHDTRHKWSDNTRIGYMNAMRRDLMSGDTASLRISDVTRRDLMRLVDASTARSTSSGALFFRTLASFLSWADARGLTEVTLPKAGRAAPSPDARTRIMSEAETLYKRPTQTTANPNWAHAPDSQSLVPVLSIDSQQAERFVTLAGKTMLTQGVEAGHRLESCWLPWQRDALAAIYQCRESLLIMGKGSGTV